MYKVILFAAALSFSVSAQADCYHGQDLICDDIIQKEPFTENVEEAKIQLKAVIEDQEVGLSMEYTYEKGQFYYTEDEINQALLESFIENFQEKEIKYNEESIRSLIVETFEDAQEPLASHQVKKIFFKDITKIQYFKL